MRSYLPTICQVDVHGWDSSFDELTPLPKCGAKDILPRILNLKVLE